MSCFLSAIHNHQLPLSSLFYHHQLPLSIIAKIMVVKTIHISTPECTRTEFWRISWKGIYLRRTRTRHWLFLNPLQCHTSWSMRIFLYQIKISLAFISVFLYPTHSTTVVIRKHTVFINFLHLFMDFPIIWEYWWPIILKSAICAILAANLWQNTSPYIRQSLLVVP